MKTYLHSTLALGRALRDARRAKKLSQAQLADLTSMAQPTISNIERGTSQVTIGTLLRITPVLGLEILLQDRSPNDLDSPWDSDR